MKRMAALMGALLLTVVLAAPAMANEKVHIGPPYSGEDQWEYKVELGNCGGPPDWEGWCELWQCSEPIYYGGTWKGDLWFWYKNGVAEEDRIVEDGAWPWIKGQSINQGIDYFSSKPGADGKVISGKYKFTVHMNDHYLGDPSTAGDDPHIWADPETWVEKLAGRIWGITAPGYGPVAFMAGSERYRMTVTDQTPDAEGYDDDYIREWSGNITFDEVGVCGAFGLGVEYAPEP